MGTLVRMQSSFRIDCRFQVNRQDSKRIITERILAPKGSMKSNRINESVLNSSRVSSKLGAIQNLIKPMLRKKSRLDDDTQIIAHFLTSMSLSEGEEILAGFRNLKKSSLNNCFR